MDTKLKKSKFNPFIKLTAIILTLVFAFLTGVNCLDFIRESIFYASENGDYTTTISFANNIYSTLLEIQNIKYITNVYEDISGNYEDFKKTDTAKEIIKNYEKKEKRALKLFNTIQDLKKLKPYEETTQEQISGRLPHWYADVSEFENVYYYDENFNFHISEYELQNYLNEYYPDGEYHLIKYYGNSDYDEDFCGVNSSGEIIEATSVKAEFQASIPGDKELFTLKENYSTYEEWNEKYQQLRAAIFTIVNDATSEETIKNELESRCNNELDSTYSDHQYLKKRIDKFVNIGFLLKDNSTGKTVSNIPSNKQDAFIKNLKSDSLFYINFDGKKLNSPSTHIYDGTTLLKLVTEVFPNNEFNTIESVHLKSYFDGYTLYLKLNKNVQQGDEYYSSVTTFNEVNKNGSTASTLGFTALFAILSVASLVAACIMSGWREDGTIKLASTDKIPFILYLAATLALLFLSGAGVVISVLCDISPYDYGPDYLVSLIFTSNSIKAFTGIFFTLFSLFLTSFILYIVRNSKAGTVRNRFAIGFITYKIKKAIRRLEDLPVTAKQIRKRTYIIVSGFVIINLICLLLLVAEIFIIAIPLLIIFNALSLVYAILYLSDVLRLASIAEQIKNNTFETVIKPENFIKPLRKFAIDLSDCRDSIETAVNNAIKGEHLKTELITNVSHDLKTPLTSIINYVSLLKMVDIESEDAKGYIDILDSKSKKLKRLIEDLTEASKATSGNIKMLCETVALNELALQAVGENSDVLENVGLDIVLTEKDSDIYILADSQHTFRIIDNLFSNAKKYSLQGTRVYVDIYKEGSYGVFSIKNISRDKLNINPDELTERFVRGDNSRTTDGSGLGLSIARSFTELQNGVFEIKIDGDMFKAIVKLPLTTPPRATENQE